ncbi:Hpt domain-containing protein [Lacinutrix sp. C3R15]|uniref:Hpt domain-containing protein n=1 Tax=Flavobacteriaceae TaxID=49546 RepID=UPI001C08046B|nr:MULTISPECIES: Hpt domain-containing protein [Flavobacteriaceae]MBU2939501.1 Hpt domain-containing protein [Lacinutrix sp. C3R15]MDO6622816.1 Hpt domain-containing protein [Oceanihabitans sp. 1_MG-2023]
MEQHYKLFRVRELADGDQDFINVLAQTFLEEVPADAKILKEAVESNNHLATYQTAHKMKPTIDMFELGVLQDLIEVQDWGKYEKKEVNIIPKLEIVLAAIEQASNEIRSDFNL